jgi:hypothetical protein
MSQERTQYKADSKHTSIHYHRIARGFNLDDIVMDLINALPGNSSVNTVHYATIGRMFIARC